MFSHTAFGLALGGGGVKGLAHIALLKKLDALRARPAAIAGTSMGAIIGALYASGLSGLEIEQRVCEHLFSREAGFKDVYRRRGKLVKWMKVFAFERARGGFLTADGLFEHLFSEIREHSFESLHIPFTAVATDFHRAEEVAMSSGPLLDAVCASMAVPGVFAPVIIGGRTLIDGGLLNNVPCEYVAGDGRKIVASDVICLTTAAQPKVAQVLSGALSIMLSRATKEKFQACPPDFCFRPNTDQIDAFDFHRIKEVLARGEIAIQQCEGEIEKTLTDE